MICGYCERACDIPETMNGYCRMYRNEEGTITENYPDSYLNVYPVSSESIPMLHFYPNSVFLLVSTIGCNLACDGCISEFQTLRPGTLQDVLTLHTPEEIVAIAKEGSCRGITFCLNEPAVSYPTFLRVARAAKKEGLLVGCSSNGYMTAEALQGLIPYLDFVNIGLKGYSDGRYRECGAASASPVYRNLKTLHYAGIAVELSVMYLNGREGEETVSAERVRERAAEIPFQVMRVRCMTRQDREASAPTREQGEQLCAALRQHLRHVYLFNTLATTELDSRCPVCGETIVHRVFFSPMAARLISCRPDGVCSCGYRFPCKGAIAAVPEGGQAVLGGYRSIMGVQFIGEIARTLGVDNDREIDCISNTVIDNGYLRDLDKRIATIEGYLGMIRYVASLAGREAEGFRIAEYVESAIADVRARAPAAGKPRVLTVMSHPLLPMYAPKPANLPVEIAGGASLNRECNFRESTDAEYNAGAFTRLDPEVVLVAGHAPDLVAEFATTCDKLGISCRALETGRVYPLSVACAAGPRELVAGVYEIAHHLHPEVFRQPPAGGEERSGQAAAGPFS